MLMEAFEPRIIGFCCNWCSYTGADLAGTSRFKYLGIDPRRMRLEWVSAGEGSRFAEVVKEFIEEMRGLGPRQSWDSPRRQIASPIKEAAL
jgi:coenzyme F420-reducing hydrogenase delta subunit